MHAFFAQKDQDDNFFGGVSLAVVVILLKRIQKFGSSLSFSLSFGR